MLLGSKKSKSDLTFFVVTALMSPDKTLELESISEMLPDVRNLVSMLRRRFEKNLALNSNELVPHFVFCDFVERRSRAGVHIVLKLRGVSPEEVEGFRLSISQFIVDFLRGSHLSLLEVTVPPSQSSMDSPKQ